MAAGADEDGDAFGRVIAASRQNQIEDAARFVLGRAVFSALDQRMHADPAIRPRRPSGGRFGIANRAHFRHILRRKDARKGRIDPIDNAGKGAVVAKQAQMFKPQIADTALAHAQEKPDIGLAKTVDRLHRIADHEQRPAIVRHPAAGQLFDQCHLGRAGVLEFIDQQMPDTVIERLRQIGRRFVVAQRQPGASRNFDEIDLAGFLKSQP